MERKTFERNLFNNIYGLFMAMGLNLLREKGTYITIEAEDIRTAGYDTGRMKSVAGALAREIKHMLPSGENKKAEDLSVLVVGLGNRDVTPDALGPYVISNLEVSRHIYMLKERHKKSKGVSAMIPGVMAQSGMESAEMVAGIVSQIKPDVVIAIDALAARRSNRINAAIQMSDTGVAPGAGVGNKRMTLDEDSLGIPVIAIGVPTVVDAATLVNDTMDRILGEMMQQTEKGTAFYQTLQSLEQEEKYQMIADILGPYTGNMFVTPKEVDAVVDRLANIIANAVNIAIHPGVTMEDINKYTF